MSILVTGGAGYIGSHVVLDLLDQGHDVHVIDNLETGHPLLVDQRAILHIGSVHDGPFVESILKQNNITIILHFAAYIRVEESVQNPHKYYHNNTSGVMRLLDTATRCGLKRFIFSSTAAVYGIPETESVSEASPLLPINPYGASKMMAERIVQDMSAAHGFDYTILRYFNVAGADSKLRSGQISNNATHLIKVACEVAVGKRDSMNLYGADYPTSDGTCVRDYIHVSDLSAAHLAVLDNPHNQILNCGYGHGFSVREVLQAVEKISGRKLTINYSPRRAGDPPSLIANADLLKSSTNWQPRYDKLDAIIKSALDWEKHLMLLNNSAA